MVGIVVDGVPTTCTATGTTLVSGFKRLVNEGAFCRNAHLPYVPTDTGPGHASLYTGTALAPWHRGQRLFVRSLGRTVYCAEDTAVLIVAWSWRHRPFTCATAGHHPADELERATQGRSGPSVSR